MTFACCTVVHFVVPEKVNSKQIQSKLSARIEKVANVRFYFGVHMFVCIMYAHVSLHKYWRVSFLVLFKLLLFHPFGSCYVSFIVLLFPIDEQIEADIKFAEMILNMSDEEEESMSGEEELFSQSKKDIHAYVEKYMHT